MPGCLLLYAYYGTVYATIQDIVEPSLRGMAMAIYFCAMYLLGGRARPGGDGLDQRLLRPPGRGRRRLDDPERMAQGRRTARRHVPHPDLDAALVVVLFAASRTVKRDYLRRHNIAIMLIA